MSQIITYIGGTVTIDTITGNSGGAVGPAAGNITLVGSGALTVTGNPGTNTLTITDTGGGLPWTVVAGASATMAVNNGYIANNAGTCVLTLPATAAVGSIIRVTGINNNTGWQIAQNAGQTIHISTSNTTTGAGGSLASSHTRDSVELVCVIANTDWNALSIIGNITVV